MFEQKFVSRAGLDQAELDYKAAQARVGALQANAGQASQNIHHHHRAYFATGVARKLAIPDSAVLRRSEVTAAYVQSAGGQAQLRQNRVGDASGDGFTEVLSGLRKGERIALDPVRAGLLSSPAEK